MPSFLSILENQIRAKRTAISKLQADLAALERTLFIMQTEHADQEQPVLFDNLKGIMEQLARDKKGKSVPDLCYAVLRGAGHPLTIEQIMPLLRAQGCAANVHTVRGTLYRYIKNKKLFRKESPGVFGLLEWNANKDVEDIL